MPVNPCQRGRSSVRRYGIGHIFRQGVLERIIPAGFRRCLGELLSGRA